MIDDTCINWVVVEYKLLCWVRFVFYKIIICKLTGETQQMVNSKVTWEQTNSQWVDQLYAYELIVVLIWWVLIALFNLFYYQALNSNYFSKNYLKTWLWLVSEATN